jgi:hypothetical protein
MLNFYSKNGKIYFKNSGFYVKYNNPLALMAHGSVISNFTLKSGHKLSKIGLFTKHSRILLRVGEKKRATLWLSIPMAF